MEFDLATQLSAFVSTTFLLYFATQPSNTQEFKIRGLEERRKFVTYTSLKERHILTRIVSHDGIE